MANNIKQKRLEGIIRKDISEIIMYEVNDPMVAMATITDVKVSNDHSYATVYVSFMGNANRTGGIKALERAKGFIRSELAKRLDIRRTPELLFKIDEAEERGRRIDEIIEQIHANDSKDDENGDVE